jgi:hypothetical protein
MLGACVRKVDPALQGVKPMGDDPMALLGLEGALKHYYEDLKSVAGGSMGLTTQSVVLKQQELQPLALTGLLTLAPLDHHVTTCSIHRIHKTPTRCSCVNPIPAPATCTLAGPALS